MRLAGSTSSTSAEKIDEQQAEPEHRHHAEHDDDAHADAVEQAALPERGNDAERDADTEHDHRAADEQDDGVQRLVEDEPGDGLVEAGGLAQIALQQVAQPHEVLDVGRAVEAEVAAHPGDRLGVAGLAPQQADRRVARQRLKQDEDQDGDAPEREERQDRSLCQESNQEGSLCGATTERGDRRVTRSRRNGRGSSRTAPGRPAASDRPARPAATSRLPVSASRVRAQQSPSHVRATKPVCQSDTCG